MIEERKIGIDEINEIANKIAKIDGVKAVYLFGSYVTGKTHKNSDIDICVIYDKNAKKAENEILSFGGGNLDIVFFWRLPLPIRFRVFKEGKVLVINDKEFVDDLKIETMNEYFDLKPFLDRRTAARSRMKLES
ncbi:MAG: nucleotidyltransferase domain-containing protein [Nanoarchaeota archaeon]